MILKSAGRANQSKQVAAAGSKSNANSKRGEKKQTDESLVVVQANQENVFEEDNSVIEAAKMIIKSTAGANRLKRETAAGASRSKKETAAKYGMVSQTDTEQASAKPINEKGRQRKACKRKLFTRPRYMFKWPIKSENNCK